ncbi:uncharacterized protein C6orf118 homolog [Bufo bufo]|uniref:uncharacterized protein C6orf118 homolog n=1 Tax=Bufo bufo TaxID=8384 RepID=UPI001ABEBA58|nr:uncharacterized protein C6orf118 homolog [Bufo bufo]
MPDGTCVYRIIDSETANIMLKTKQQARNISLDVLLDSVEQANKKDSWDYTGGHLNHNHIFKPPVLEEKCFWISGKKPDQQNEKVKKTTSIKFKLKASLVDEDPKVKSFCVNPSVMKQTGPFTPINTPFASSIVDSRSQTTFQDTPEHTEYRESPPKFKELELPELKLLSFGEPQTSKDKRKEYRYLPAYFIGLTKSDQFNMFSQYNREILQKQDISKDFYKNVAVECYEKKLTKELLNIAHIRPPHFARLQIFSETFEKIWIYSSIFGNILSEIKAVYDLYVDCLLDAQSSPQHEILMSEIAGMKKRPVKTEDVEEVMQNVRELEHQAFIALEHNDQLRNYLKTELNNEFISETVPDEASQLHSRETDPTSEKCHSSETEVFVAKRNEVLKTLLEVKALEEDMGKNLTHAVNVEAVEQYIKDMQTETLKLQSSNDFLHRANKDLDSEIKRGLMKQKLTLDKQEEIKILMEFFLNPPDL